MNHPSSHIVTRNNNNSHFLADPMGLIEAYILNDQQSPKTILSKVHRIIKLLTMKIKEED